MAKKIRESEVKNRIRQEYFADFDWTRAVGNIDLTVCSPKELGAIQVTYLWCETKSGNRKDIYESLIQLILTIGKEKTFESEMPPYFLGAADAEKIAFVEYNRVMHIFSKTDFNWKVTPSDHQSKEFKELYSLLHEELSDGVILFNFTYERRALKSFIRRNFKTGRSDVAKISIGKNNFTFVYYDWVKTVKDSIAVDWKSMQKAGILDCDFFLADLMSKNGMSIKNRLKVVLEKTRYKVLVSANIGGVFGDAYQDFGFLDGQKAYNQFWNRYERPPKPVYQKYILDRHDLLVPQDIREIKGSYYTPEPWVRLSQKYLADTLGEDWQDEYYVWDCAAGSGNLLRGLTNKYNVYASTLDDSDVRIMHDAIDGGRLNLLKNNVFQFDFLNDGYDEKGYLNWSKLPDSLRQIIFDETKRKKLIIYINPPYAEAANAKNSSGSGTARIGVAKSRVHDIYFKLMGRTSNELFAQFYVRCFMEIPSCILAEFSTLKILQGPNFRDFRKLFPAKLLRMFIVPSFTFDNVKGIFPIGFQIFDTDRHEPFEETYCDVIGHDSSVIGKKLVSSYSDKKYIIDWIRNYYDKAGAHLCYLRFLGTDFQHNSDIFLTLKPYENDLKQVKGTWVTRDNIIPCMVYFAVRRCLEKNWVNDRDQFLYPDSGWETDVEFQADCIMFSLFNTQNRISSAHGINHWIPYYEDEVNSPVTFNSRLLADLLHGKTERKSLSLSKGPDLFSEQERIDASTRVLFDNLSEQGRSVYDAGKDLWTYYLSKPGCDPNGCFYDIKAFFQGYKTSASGKKTMNTDSSDQRYTLLLEQLRRSLKALAGKIEEKIYQYGFLIN